MEIHRKLTIKATKKTVILRPKAEESKVWILRGVYPEPEILRFAQNDKRRAQDDKPLLGILIFSLTILLLIHSSDLSAFDIEGKINVTPPSDCYAAKAVFIFD